MTERTSKYLGIPPNILFDIVRGKRAREYIQRSKLADYDNAPYRLNYKHLEEDADKAEKFWNKAEDLAESGKDIEERISAESRSKVGIPPPARKKSCFNSYSSFQEDLENFEHNYAKQFETYLESIGRESFNYVGTTEDFLGENIAAAVAIDEIAGNAALIANSEYDSLKNQLAEHYNVSSDIAAEYIQAHERTHLYQKGMNLDSFSAERDVETTLINYFSKCAEQCPEQGVRYDALTSIAQDRLSNIDSNYG